MPSAKILVVDDSRTIRVQVARMLSNTGYQVFTASDGMQALDLVQKHQPALLILDVNMPMLDGFGVCEKMNQNLIDNRPPVIFLTSLHSKALELLGHEFGAYLHKPVRQSDLLSAVEKQLLISCLQHR